MKQDTFAFETSSKPSHCLFPFRVFFCGMTACRKSHRRKILDMQTKESCILKRLCPICLPDKPKEETDIHILFPH